MKRILPLFIYLIICTPLFAQQTNDTVEYYMNYDGVPCQPDSAYYYRLAYKDGNLWKVKDFYIIQQVKRMEGYYAEYKDGNFKGRQGMFFYYYPNGKIDNKMRYINNSREGVYKAYNENGLLIDSAFYKNDKLIKCRYKWNDKGTQVFRGIYTEDGWGSGTEEIYFDDGKLSAAGKVLNGSYKDSLWTYYHNNGKISCTEFYEYGLPKERKCYDPSGKSEGDCNEMIAPYYDKKRNNMYHLVDPELLDMVNSDYIGFTVKILIDKDGKVLNAEMITKPLVTQIFYNRAIQQLYYMPKWIPGKEHNRPTKMYTNLWVTVIRG